MLVLSNQLVARKSFLNNNPELIEKFTEAINKGLEFVKNNDSKTIANIILPSFPDSSLNDIETIINNYKKYDSWLENPYITEESFKNLENILLDNKLIKDYVPYNKLINNFYEK